MDEYVVVLADDVLPSQVPSVARELALGHDIRVDRVWTHALKAFSGSMREERAIALSRHPRVKYVEENASWHLSGSHPTNIDPRACDPTATVCSPVMDNRLWHLDRVDQNSANPSNRFAFGNDGTGVTVYVVDTGVNKNHQEFAASGRVQAGYNASGDLMPADDPCIGFPVPPVPNSDYAGIDSTNFHQELDSNGHGTAVASVLGGQRIGVAKGVTIVPIKVNRCDRAASRARLSNYLYQQHETIFYSENGYHVTRL